MIGLILNHMNNYFSVNQKGTDSEIISFKEIFDYKKKTLIAEGLFLRDTGSNFYSDFL